MFKQIKLVKIRHSSRNNINQDIQWLSASLGMFNKRDREKSCYRIFIELLKHAKDNQPLSSDQIARATRLNRSTVIHHLTKLVDSGLVINEKGMYLLREPTLTKTIESITRDIEYFLSDVKYLSNKIDKKLELR